jgi:hypothetical protein
MPFDFLTWGGPKILRQVNPMANSFGYFAATGRRKPCASAGVQHGCVGVQFRGGRMTGVTLIGVDAARSSIRALVISRYQLAEFT